MITLIKDQTPIVIQIYLGEPTERIERLFAEDHIKHQGNIYDSRRVCN